ncbi:hypothetical protein BCR34DRAFT_597658 [Clohesyomyces aquaticus]|uniref:Protein kinase domain-containing protein n=1 Tax=Clohesyomyces aquaticus TaxID=1231657 RepID=A0A1Y2A1N0_9PLEO|nr:hypothetical protein BCR34DRAFT_597658 [Clohesyomyces aquaticus]
MLVKLNLTEDLESGETLRVSSGDKPKRAHAKGNEYRYPEIKLLGAGDSGQVHLCEDLRRGELVAVKTLEHTKADLPHEVKVLIFIGQQENIVAITTFSTIPQTDRCAASSLSIASWVIWATMPKLWQGMFPNCFYGTFSGRWLMQYITCIE